MRILFLFASFTFIVISATAQDKIYRKNGKTVQAKIIEVGSSEIKYKIFGDDTGPVYILETDKIKKVEFQNGTTQKFVLDINDPEQYEGQLRKAIKIDFFGPLVGYTQISYEKSTGIGRSYEVGLAIIGAGKNSVIDYYNSTLRTTRTNQFGFAGSFGYKFNKLPDFLFGRSRFTHVMQGAYAKPIIYLGNYSENGVQYKLNLNSPEIKRQNVFFGALQIELGKQWVFSDKFLIDLYWGFGYGFDNKKNGDDYYYDDNSGAFNYLNARLGRSPGFSVTGGLKLGLLIK
ncbi:MAG: hypothetical protein M3Y85_00065 [Bacteroidota bacterium]|nr:hypothetical protein [Bacteroidota bacterium]